MKLFFTPGPSQLYKTVPAHIQTSLRENLLSISHRSAEFRNIFKSATQGLRQLLNIPESHEIILTSSATQAMEIIIRNCVNRYSTHFVGGAFANRFFEIATKLGKNSEKIRFENEQIFDPETNLSPESELICFTQNETSTGVSLNPQSIAQFRKKYPQKLVAVDIVSSCPQVELDWNATDISFFSVQKGFGLPAGLGVIILSPQAFEKSQDATSTGFQNFPDLVKAAHLYQTIETPNILAIFLLDQLIKDFAKIGIAKIRAQGEAKAKLIYTFFDNHPKFTPAIKNPDFRSITTIAIETGSSSEDLIKRLAKKGFILGAGYGEKRNTQLRIANFPAHSIEDVKGLLQAFEKI